MAKCMRSRRKRRLRAWLRDPHCFWCNERLDPALATIDHVVPLSKGGRPHHDNEVLSCYACNQAKGNKFWPRYKKGFREKRKKS